MVLTLSLSLSRYHERKKGQLGLVLKAEIGAAHSRVVKFGAVSEVAVLSLLMILFQESLFTLFTYIVSNSVNEYKHTHTQTLIVFVKFLVK